MNALAADVQAPALDNRFIYPHKVAVGVDLGQSHDPTSIAVVEQIKPTLPDSVVERMQYQGQHSMLADLRRALPRPIYNLRLLEQAPLGESYPEQAHRLNRILSRASIAEHDPRVFMDYTGVGRAVYDIFTQERVPRLVPITITFNGGGRKEGGGYSVPKLELVGRLQALAHTGCLQMPESMPLIKTFRRELMDFRVTYTAVGNATFGARTGAHDDLILAVALAVFGLEGGQGQRAQIVPLRL